MIRPIMSTPLAWILQTIISQQYWIIGSQQIIRSRLKLSNSALQKSPLQFTTIYGRHDKMSLETGEAIHDNSLWLCRPNKVKVFHDSPQCIKSGLYLPICMYNDKSITFGISSGLIFGKISDGFLSLRFMTKAGWTNVVAAAKLVQTADQFTQSKEFQDKCYTYLISRNISWNLDPPSTPHFGGLWEAGVKSVKTLLY